MALAMWPILIVAAAFLLYTNHAAALTSPRAPQLKPADELVDWVLGRGGKVRETTVDCALQASQPKKANVMSKCCPG